MNIWEFLDRQIERVGRIEPRQLLAACMFSESVWLMASIIRNPGLAQIEFFKLLAQAIVIQGFLTTVLAFYFTASKSSEKERENLGAALGVADKAADAAKVATAAATGAPASPQSATLTGTLEMTGKEAPTDGQPPAGDGTTS